MGDEWHLALSVFVASSVKKLHQPCDMPKYTDNIYEGYSFFHFGDMAEKHYKMSTDEHMGHLLTR